MMDIMRNAAKSWVAKLLIFMLAGSFGIWGIADVFRGYHAGALATVGGVEISGDQFTRAFNRALQNLQRQTGQALSPDEARKMGIDRSVLNNLIQSAAVDSQSLRMKLAVSDAQIVHETETNPAFKDASGKFSPAEFLRRLEAAGLNEQMYLQQEKQARLQTAVVGTADADFSASRTLIEANYRHDNEQRDAHYFVIRTADSEAAEPTEDEIKAQYDANPPLYTAPEYRSIALMKAEPDDVAALLKLSGDDLKAGYEKYKSEYFAPERRTVLQITFPTLEEAQKAHDRIAKGEDFLAIAKERGIGEADATFADKTKDAFLDPDIAKAAFSLPGGGLSDPIKGGLAIALLKIAKISPEHQGSLDEVKDKLSQRLKADRARDEIGSIHDSVEDARAAKTNFEDIARKAGIPFQLVAAVDQQGNGKDGKPVQFPHSDEILRGAYSENMDVGTEVDPISLDNGGYVWYEIRSVAPSAVKPLAAVHDQARADIVAKRVSELSAGKAKALVARADAGSGFESLAKETGQTIQTALGLKRGEPAKDFDAAAVKALFSVTENGFAYAVDADGRSAKVMQSQEVLLPSFDATSASSKEIGKTLQASTGGDLVSAYMAALQKEAGVSINETLWRQISGAQPQ